MRQNELAGGGEQGREKDLKIARGYLDALNLSPSPRCNETYSSFFLLITNGFNIFSDTKHRVHNELAAFANDAKHSESVRIRNLEFVDATFITMNAR